eukprot:g2690.t1
MLKEAFQKMEKKLVKTEERLQNALKDVKMKSGKIEEAQRTSAKYKRECERLQEQVSEYVVKMEEVKKYNSSLERKLTRGGKQGYLAATVNKLRSKVASLRAEREDLRTNLSEKSELLTKLEEESSLLRSALNVHARNMSCSSDMSQSKVNSRRQRVNSANVAMAVSPQLLMELAKLRRENADLLRLTKEKDKRISVISSELDEEQEAGLRLAKEKHTALQLNEILSLKVNSLQEENNEKEREKEQCKIARDAMLDYVQELTEKASKLGEELIRTKDAKTRMESELNNAKEKIRAGKKRENEAETALQNFQKLRDETMLEDRKQFEEKLKKMEELKDDRKQLKKIRLQLKKMEADLKISKESEKKKKLSLEKKTKELEVARNELNACKRSIKAQNELAEMINEVKSLQEFKGKENVEGCFN